MFKRVTMIAWLVGLVAFAQSMSAIADDTPIRLAGRLTKITGKTLTITTDNGTATAITCNDATKLGRDGVQSAVKLTDLKVGQPVRAYYTKPENIAIAVFIEASRERPKQPAGVKLLRDLQYVEGGHERNRLDLYLPEKAEGRLPLVVWIHGGAWAMGSKEGCPAVPLTTKGYAVASINYRLSQHAIFPAQIEDCKAAIRWLRANAAKYHLDADHIGVWGSSAGGHLVAMLGTTGDVKELEGKGGNLDQSSRVQCVVDWFGPSDLPMGGSHDDPSSPESRLIGGPVLENKEKARKASPLTYVSKDSAPFLIMHGDQDNVVPPGQSDVLAKALKKAGVEVTLVVVKGNGHGGPGFNSPENRKLIEDFFAKHLRTEKP